MAPIKLRPRDVVLVLVPALLWWGLYHIRPNVIDPVCAQSPETCTKASVNWPDRVSIGIDGGNSDFLSDYSQYAAGTLAVLGPALLRILERAPLALALRDPVVLLQAAFVNGAFNESVRLVIQRPRPYVYRDPKELGQIPVSYTSFYSGHTSFAAVSAAHFILVVVQRRQNKRRLWLWTSLSLVSVSLVFLTALFRVLAGYHFMTDVVVGAAAGALAAWAMHRVGRRQSA